MEVREWGEQHPALTVSVWNHDKTQSTVVPLRAMLVADYHDVLLLHEIAYGRTDSLFACDVATLYRLQCGNFAQDPMVCAGLQMERSRYTETLTRMWEPSAHWQELERWAADKPARIAQYEAAMYFYIATNRTRNVQYTLKYPASLAGIHGPHPLVALERATDYWDTCYSDVDLAWQAKRSVFVFMCRNMMYKKPPMIANTNHLSVKDMYPAKFNSKYTIPLHRVEDRWDKADVCKRLFDAAHELRAAHPPRLRPVHNHKRNREVWLDHHGVFARILRLARLEDTAWTYRQRKYMVTFMSAALCMIVANNAGQDHWVCLEEQEDNAAD